MTLARRAIAAAVVIVATGCDGGAPPQLELGTVATEQAAGPAGGELARVEVASNVKLRVLKAQISGPYKSPAVEDKPAEEPAKK